jgi:alcohol dehydrogenase
MTEALAHASIRLITENLRQAVFHGDDLEARDNMLMGSLLGGLALANAGVGAAHALAYPLGGNYRVPHGLANAILIPHVMEFNLPAAQKQFMMVAQCMGEPVGGLSITDAANAAVQAVQSLCRDIGIPSSLSELGISSSDIPMLVEGALTVARPIENNPRYVGPDEAHLIYDRAFV